MDITASEDFPYTTFIRKLFGIHNKVPKKGESVNTPIRTTNTMRTYERDSWFVCSYHSS
jgi:hypothetical protein